MDIERLTPKGHRFFDCDYDYNYDYHNYND